ncbi:MAG: hypothetical protein FWE62_03555 [Firmicutes bacterium]|nr:hypothetical protein [Bacillota bacterium]
MTRIHKKLKAKRQTKYLQKLEEQRIPLTAKQFRKLAKCESPDGVPFHEFMLEWGIKSRQRQEREDQMVAGFISMVADRVVRETAWAEIREKRAGMVVVPAVVGPEREPKPAPVWKKPAFRWAASAAAACALCLAIAFPIMLGGGGLPDPGVNPNGNLSGDPDGGKEKSYTVWNAKILDSADGIYFDDIYAEMLGDEGILVFATIISVSEAHMELYDDETEELLSYALLEMLVDASAGADLIVFYVDYRIRSVPEYKFARYEIDFGGLADKFDIGETEVKYKIIATSAEDGEEEERIDTTLAFVSFAYGVYDYFLRISVFELMPGMIVTDLKEESLILLMENLIPIP